MWWITWGLGTSKVIFRGCYKSKDSAQFETEAALRVPGTGNVPVHQCSQTRICMTGLLHWVLTIPHR